MSLLIWAQQNQQFIKRCTRHSEISKKCLWMCLQFFVQGVNFPLSNPWLIIGCTQNFFLFFLFCVQSSKAHTSATVLQSMMYESVCGDHHSGARPHIKDHHRFKKLLLLLQQLKSLMCSHPECSSRTQRRHCTSTGKLLCESTTILPCLSCWFMVYVMTLLQQHNIQWKWHDHDYVFFHDVYKKDHVYLSDI
jgi:hypothetical protein